MVGQIIHTVIFNFNFISVSVITLIKVLYALQWKSSIIYQSCYYFANSNEFSIRTMNLSYDISVFNSSSHVKFKDRMWVKFIVI